MSTPGKKTFFARPERAEEDDLRRQKDLLGAESFTVQLLDVIPTVLVILNRQRQIVYANRGLQEMLGLADLESTLGLRPGEALGCHRVESAPRGCGTAEECRACGAVLAILASLEGRPDVQECRIVRATEQGREALDLRVWATPLDFGEERFSIFAVSDISHEKRRRVLERVFFHDVLNTAGSIRGLSDLVRSNEQAPDDGFFDLIHAAAERIIDEIEGQRTLAAAEAGELRLNPSAFIPRDFLELLADVWRGQSGARGRILKVECDPEPGLVFADTALLGRVLTNLLKNALEASREGATVTLGFRRNGNRGLFLVNNPEMIPEEIRGQIFHRSFSTKGEDRGLGTYGARLLTDILEGEISFTSHAEGGTTFMIDLPLTDWENKSCGGFGQKGGLI